MPGPGFAGVPYPPPPGWFPPGQGFPQGPGPWSNAQFPGGPGGPGGPQGPSAPQRGPPSGPAQGVKPGPAAEQAKASAAVPTEPKSLAQGGRQSANAPNLPVDSKPSVEEVKAVATNLSNGSGATKNRANNRPTPVVPLTGSTAKPFQLPNAGKPPSASAKAPSAAAPTSVEDATNAARAAVAVAMAQLGNSGTTAMDNLTNKVNEMRVHASRGTGTSSGRGRGRGGRQGAPKVEVPDSDFDFAQSNAKFNREEIAKEAIASGDLVESPNEPVIQEPEVEPASSDPAAGTYNRSRSFFDNISSESRERAENGGQKPGGREWRGEEQRKNMETFGQGSVDGGYRNYRGRGRGRGGRGRGGFNRGGRGGNRPQYQTATADQ